MVVTRAQHRKLLAWDIVESAEGVFIDILSRLSVRSIRSFKTVNRYWYRSISNKYCAMVQLAQSRKKPSYIACPSMDTRMELYLLKPGICNFQHLTTVDPSERSVENYMYMISSFNGLVCCINQLSVEYEEHLQDIQIWICNPCTEDTLLLPQGTPSFGSVPSIGVACGPGISDYRVFRIFCVGEKNREDVYADESGEAFLYECEVYSSRTGAWRNIGPVPHLPMRVCFRPYKSSHVFARGKIYWLVSLDDRGKILSVDMEEKFKVMELPEYGEDLHEDDKITEATYLITLGGQLSVVILHADHIDVWVREEDSEQSDPWVLVCINKIPFTELEVVLFITSSEKEILFATETHLWTYDLDSVRWKRRTRPPTEFVNPAILPFTESLVPCNGEVSL